MNRPTSARYRTPNWSSCTASLKKSGSLLILLDKEMTWLLFDSNPAGSQAPGAECDGAGGPGRERECVDLGGSP